MTNAPDDPQLVLTPSRRLPEWMGKAGCSLAFTTYQAGKLFLIGLQPDGRLSIFERSFPRCMGLASTAEGRQLILGAQYQIYRLDNALSSGESAEGFDALYVPRLSWITGDLDAHDMAYDGIGRPMFISTLFSCLATVSDGFSFKPLWRPGFISKLVPEDRCHLNGLAAENGEARYATAVSTSDVSDGWRDKRADGGVLIDIGSDQVVLEGLSMPHSPRLYRGRVWLLNSGAGQFGFADLETGRFEPVAFCPGYARGLTMIGDYAVIGLSLARKTRTFHGLPLDGALQDHGAEARCGLIVVDITSGDTVAWLRIEGIVDELYDVVALPSIQRPSALGFKTDEIERFISIDE